MLLANNLIPHGIPESPKSTSGKLQSHSDLALHAKPVLQVGIDLLQHVPVRRSGKIVSNEYEYTDNAHIEILKNKAFSIRFVSFLHELAIIRQNTPRFFLDPMSYIAACLSENFDWKLEQL